MFSKIMKNMDAFKQAKVIQKEKGTGDAEGGKITVSLNGIMQIEAISIDASLMSPENKDRVERGIKAAADKAMMEVAKKLKNLPELANMSQ